MTRAAFVWRDDLTAYKLSATHPLNPVRLEATMDLLRTTGMLRPEEVVSCEAASVEDIALVHDRDYIEAVQRLSKDPASLSGAERLDGATYGFGSGDNPVFDGMHDASSLVTGATIKAADLVMEGRARRAFNVAGGLHHALKDRAAGFCVYNDPAVAAAHVRKKYGARVAYIDIDAHHGDGVQWLFYEDDDVLTVSIHESGRYLFPGTGHVEERGRGPGEGASVNIPLAPHTDTASWLDLFHAIVPDALRAFRPDLIISQHGCDAHLWDPLSHLAVTTEALEQAAVTIRGLAEQLCDGRWVATGGGGYALFTVVPRAWTLLWGVIAERDVPEEIPSDWLERWEDAAAGATTQKRLPRTMRDNPSDFPSGPRQADAARDNEFTLQQLRALMEASRP